MEFIPCTLIYNEQIIEANGLSRSVEIPLNHPAFALQLLPILMQNSAVGGNVIWQATVDVPGHQEVPLIRHGMQTGFGLDSIARMLGL